MIAIVDYGMGNLRSVSKGFESKGFSVKVTKSPDDIHNSSGLVLPGVGAFGDCIKNLNQLSLIEPIKNFIKQGRPFLGICLGLQILFEESEESPGINGLGILNGKVIKFSRFEDTSLKIPHMGWNQVEFKDKLQILKGIPTGSWFYFVHSYFPAPEDTANIAGKTHYGIDFTCAVSTDNIFACQFHPEKSSTLGLRMLENFALICGEKRKLRM